MQRLRAFIQEQIEKFARFRGVLVVGLSRIRTGDCRFGALKAQQPAFFSVCKLGGSDSLSIRPSEGLGSADQYCQFELHSLRHLVCRLRDFSVIARGGRENPAIPRGIGRGASRIRTGDCGFRAQKRPRPAFSLLPSWAVRIRSRFAPVLRGVRVSKISPIDADRFSAEYGGGCTSRSQESWSISCST